MISRRGAIVGFGNVAVHGHAPVWQRRGDVHIVAVADLNPERRALVLQRFPQARVYDDPLVLLQRERLDFVDIATPPAQHVALIMGAAAAGFHVVCEKPLVTSLDDFQDVQSAVRGAEVTLFTVHNWKRAPQLVEALRLLDAGSIGRVRRLRLETERVGQSVAVGSQWRTDAAQAGGGILFDHGWHNFYLLLTLAREKPMRVAATVERRGGGGGNVEDTARCVVEFPSCSGEICLTWAGRQRRTRWFVEGEHGSIEIDENLLRLQCGGASPQTRTFDEALSAGSHHPDWFGGVIDEFFAEIDGQRPRGANLNEAGLCLTLIRLSYQSAAIGQSVNVPEELSSVVGVRPVAVPVPDRLP